MEATSAKDELQSTGYEIFIAGISVLSIVNLILSAAIEGEALTAVVLAVNALLSIILFLDFLFRLFTAESKRHYFFHEWGWADLLASLPFTQVKVLRVFRLVRVYRLLRAVGPRYIGHALLRSRAGSALLSLLMIAILMLEFGSLAVLSMEEGEPGANIESASDAIWYVLATMSTVGYGDQYPVTNSGRVLGTVIIVVGVGIFGTLTGFLANAFLPGPDESEDDLDSAGTSEEAESTPAAPTTGAQPGDLDPDLVRELEALRLQHQEALDRLDLLLGKGGQPSTARGSAEA